MRVKLPPVLKARESVSAAPGELGEGIGVVVAVPFPVRLRMRGVCRPPGGARWRLWGSFRPKPAWGRGEVPVLFGTPHRQGPAVLLPCGTARRRDQRGSQPLLARPVCQRFVPYVPLPGDVPPPPPPPRPPPRPPAPAPAPARTEAVATTAPAVIAAPTAAGTRAPAAAAAATRGGARGTAGVVPDPIPPTGGTATAPAAAPGELRSRLSQFLPVSPQFSHRAPPRRVSPAARRPPAQPEAAVPSPLPPTSPKSPRVFASSFCSVL